MNALIQVATLPLETLLMEYRCTWVGPKELRVNVNGMYVYRKV